jgi:acetyltransferase
MADGVGWLSHPTSPTAAHPSASSKQVCATLLLNAGAPILTVQTLLGHKHIDTTLTYARLYNGTVAADYYRAMNDVERRIVGVGRLSKIYGSDAAEFAILVSDDFQGQGLGTEFLRRLVEIGREEGDIGRITAYILAENIGMRRVAEKLGFSLKFENQLIHSTLKL